LSRDASNPSTWQDQYINDFEIPIGKLHPEIAKGIVELKQHGAFYAAMSGSGSSYFGLFLNKPLNLNEKHLIYLGFLNLNC
jgi:4-diphosphocytidyl-2-C-methyl-D-erythritol kinase